MEEEQWKPVGTSDVYQVSDAGRVKNSKTGRVKTISYDFQGNAMVYLYENHKKQKKKYHDWSLNHFAWRCHVILYSL